MRAIVLIARRELAAYLRTMGGYVILAIVLAVFGVYFNAQAIGQGAARSSEVLGRFFYGGTAFTMIAALLISMRLFAEESQSGTLSLLYSSPVRDVEIVLGKFLSALVFLALFLLLSFYMPALILVHGKVSWGHLFSGYFGLLLMGGASLALGIFGSSLTKSQVIAAIISGCILTCLVIAWELSRVTERPFSGVFGALAFYLHYQAFQTGVVHLRDVVYFVLVTYIALFATTRVLEARRWR